MLKANLYSFITKLQQDHPDLKFKFGPRFSFRPPRTIIIGPLTEELSPLHFQLLLLHELGHALSGHFDYHTDIERLRIEAEAWDKAKKISSFYQIPYDQDFAESQLDSYRDWLHQKSLCKTCQISRYQTPDGIYHCPNCKT